MVGGTSDAGSLVNGQPAHASVSGMDHMAVPSGASDYSLSNSMFDPTGSYPAVGIKAEHRGLPHSPPGEFFQYTSQLRLLACMILYGQSTALGASGPGAFGPYFKST